MVNEVRETMFAPDKPQGIEAGTIVYRNHDHEFLNRVKKAVPQRLIGVQLTLRETSDGLALGAVDEDGNTAEFAVQCEKTLAEKPEQALENARKQLAKTGGTEFTCNEVTLDLPQPLFIPMSNLNALRRGAMEELARVRSANRPVRAGGAAKNEVPYPLQTLTFEANVLNKLADAFYRRHGVTQIEPAAESGLNLRGRKVITTRYCLRHQLGMCGQDAPLTLVDAEGHRLELRFDCERCGMEVWV